VPAGVLKSVMVIVPSLSHSKNSNQWIVHGDITSLEHLSSPDMADRVNSPCDVPAEDCSESEAPNDCWEPAKSKVN